MWFRKIQRSATLLRRFTLYFTKDHEWIKYNAAQKVGTLGITHHAQSQLGDVVHLDLPEKGVHFKVGEVLGVVESVKTVADIYSPVSGTIVEANTLLGKTPEVINESPEDEGWIAKMTIHNPSELSELLDKAGYEKLLEEEQH